MAAQAHRCGDAPTDVLPGVRGATHIVNVGKSIVAAAPATLTSVGLGSCIAVCAWHPGRRVGGMLHFMLPSAKHDPKRAQSAPALFCDSGFAEMKTRLQTEFGIMISELDFMIIGGGSMQSGAGAFDVGRRNALAARKLLWAQRAKLVAEDTGGHDARTAVLDVESGELTVRKPGQPPRKLR